MPRENYGLAVKRRAKRLFQALLAYANDELEVDDRLRKEIEANWQGEIHLVIRTKVKFLEELIAIYSNLEELSPKKLNKEQIKEVINRLEDLHFLKDNRTATQGSKFWHFTLDVKTLNKLEQEWDKRRPETTSSTSESRPDVFNDRGVENYLEDRLPESITEFSKALERDPQFAATHYNLGVLYEDVKDFDRARSEYRAAILGGLTAAYNNLARLYLLEQDDAAAVDLLLKGLRLAEDEDKTEKYTLRKNLGWARFKQKRYAEAKAELLTAIELNSKQASAYGLLAQVREALGETREALLDWENYLKYASSYRPDEDTWLDLARQRLGHAGQIHH